MPFAQKHIGFKKPPRLFLRNDVENAKNPFGKTAFYDPEQKSVTLYITGRHPKDILRSLGHELVHHKQNCDGKFSDSDDMSPGYAQKDPHLRQMEMDANRDGSMCLRDFEDKLKKENTIYYEHLQKGDKKMSTKDWKNKEITQLLSEAWGFKFNSLEEFNEFNGSGELQAEGEDEELDEGSMTPHKASARRTPRGVGSADARRSGEADKDADDDRKDESLEESEKVDEGAFDASHYCIHHGGVNHNGKTEMAEAVQHVVPDENGHISHYDMKLSDGTILENVAAEDIQVTNASLAEAHGKPGKRDGHKKMKPRPSDKELEEKLGNGKTDGTDSVDAGLDDNKETTQMDNAAEHGGKRGKKKKDESVDHLQEAIVNLIRKHLRD